MPNILVVDVVLLDLTEAELEVARLSLFSPCHQFLQSGDGASFNHIISSIISHLYIHLFLFSFMFMIVELKRLVTKFNSHYSAL